MEKLTKYNQKLLAIIGTFVVGGAILALIIGIAGLVIAALDLTGGRGNNGLQLRNNPTEQTDSTEIIQRQAITFNAPIQLDTSQAKFVIPVGQVTLETAQGLKNDGRFGSKNLSAEYRHNSYTGLFNNFIFYDYSSGFKAKIFDYKVALTQWSYFKINQKELLVFKGTKNDTNSDKQLDQSDFQQIFVYYLSDNTLVEYNFKHRTVLNFEPMPKTNLLSIKVGIDNDNDLEYEHSTEPQEIIALNTSTRKIEALISQKMKEEIQNKID